MLVSDIVFDKNHNPIDMERLFSLQGYSCEPYFEQTEVGKGNFTILYNDGDASVEFGLTESDGDDDFPPMPIFYIEDISSAGGAASKVFGKVVELAKRMGIERIEVNPIQIGGYFWAAIGVEPVGESMQDLSDELSSRTNGALSFSTADEFRQIARTQEGKKALINTDWYGFIDLNNPKQMQFYEEYMTTKVGVGINN